MRAIAPAVAVGTTDEDVAQELHLDLLEAGAAAALALASRRVETERAGRQAALSGGVGLGEHLADVVECADVDGRIRPRGLAERRLVDEQNAPQMPGAGQLGGIANRAIRFGIERILGRIDGIEPIRRLDGAGRRLQAFGQRRQQDVLDQRCLA